MEMDSIDQSCYISTIQLIAHSSIRFPTIEMQHIKYVSYMANNNIQVYSI